MSNNDNISYYIRKSGVIVRLIDKVNLEYLNPECKWVPNQEWYMSMFVDGDERKEIDFFDISKSEVEAYINNQLNSSKININEDSKYPKMTR